MHARTFSRDEELLLLVLGVVSLVMVAYLFVRQEVEMEGDIFGWFNTSSWPTVLQKNWWLDLLRACLTAAAGVWYLSDRFTAGADPRSLKQGIRWWAYFTAGGAFVGGVFGSFYGGVYNWLEAGILHAGLMGLLAGLLLCSFGVGVMLRRHADRTSNRRVPPG